MATTVAILGYVIDKREVINTLFSALSSAITALFTAPLDADCRRTIMMLYWRTYAYSMVARGNSFIIHSYTMGDDKFGAYSSISPDNKYLLFPDGSRSKIALLAAPEISLSILYKHPNARYRIYVGVEFESTMLIGDIAAHIVDCVVMRLTDKSGCIIACEVDVSVDNNAFTILSDAGSIIDMLTADILRAVIADNISGRIVGEPIVVRHHYFAV